MSAIKPFLVAFALALALVPLCRQLAVRLGRVAQPRADRWHRRPIAMLGGVAIAVAMFAAASLFDVVASRPVLAGCALLAFASGLVDDLTRLKASTKLIVQIALASALLFFGYRVNWVESMTLDSLLTLFWVVGITNAFNLLDNMDGLCGGVSMIAIVGLLLEAANRGVLDTPESRIVGVFRRGRDGGEVIPADRRDKSEYGVLGHDAVGLPDGELVVAEELPSRRFGGKRARIVERLGPEVVGKTSAGRPATNSLSTSATACARRCATPTWSPAPTRPSLASEATSSCCSATSYGPAARPPWSPSGCARRCPGSTGSGTPRRSTSA